jgi:hypothetical protein
VKRRRFRDRIVAVCAVALLGSVALVPTPTLAGHSADVSGQHLTGHHPSSTGDENDLGHTLRLAHHRAAAPPATGVDDGRTISSDRARDSQTVPGGSVDGSTTSANAAKAKRAGSASTSSTGQPLTGTRVVLSAHGAPPVQGVSLPGSSAPISHPPATHPAGTRQAVPPGGSTAAPATGNPVLGPVPVLVPSIGTISRSAAVLPWNWLIGVASGAILLVALIVVTRRRARSGPL